MARASLETGPEALRDYCRKPYRHRKGACRGQVYYPKAAKKISVSPALSYEPNALDGTQIGLQTSLKLTLKGRRAVAETAAQTAWNGDDDVSSIV